MVLVVAVSAITGFIAPAWWLSVHVAAGYALAVLLAFRLVWGVVGGRYSRFGSFPLAVAGLYRHLVSVFRGKPQIFVGHNPAGAWMIVFLLLALTTLVASGVVVLGGQEDLGPLAALLDFQAGVTAAEIHEVAAWGLLAAVVIHLIGVFVEIRIFQHPVLAAMLIRGKELTGAHSGITRAAQTARGGAWFLAIAASLLAAGVALANIPSPAWRAVSVPAVYLGECGDCHDAYHPSLRSRKAWQAIMDRLPDHYGEDASLDAETAAVIRNYLDANHAGTFDTEVSHRVGRLDTPSLRMTETEYWKRRHEDIDSGVFRLPGVGSKVNCNGCHGDAASGRFDDSRIHFPEKGQR